MSDIDLTLTISPTAYNRIEDMRTAKGNSRLYLRLSVSGGGCSGFRYDFSWDDAPKADDLTIDDVVLVDEVSVPFLNGATIDYVVSMMGEQFKVINPNATSGCGCGESFSV
ncbi:MAG TPA: iron-sulfur cluster assembly accessory protein [Alphaproteobacteria bacterium]|nr:iron-sulfur cluster assembly accessory protein [Alphaproteobacteria bacterium]HNS45290.1 iron-sulfur cluster assembly accessory protein [Alphaproteobacteria bacterium]